MRLHRTAAEGREEIAMSDFNSYEYRTEQKSEGKFKLMKILLITAYIAFAGGFFGIVYTIRLIPLFALCPLFIWILVFFTWKYTKPDYKYTIEAGTLTFSVFYGSKERKVTSISLSAAAAIAPRDTLKEEIKNWKPKKTYTALPSEGESDAYTLLYNDGDANCALHFVATQQALKLLRLYNEKTVRRSTKY